MNLANINAAAALYKVLPPNLFLVAIEGAPQRRGFGYNDYTCVFGKDPEADPGDEFDGVQLIFVTEKITISEQEAYEGVLKAIAEFSASHPQLIARLEGASALIAREIEALRKPLDPSAGTL
ncbi:hypothetical protein J5226_23990 [Lysobacter sp. K5869]|uniref:hypothetical protein n=1 Tax=Lysobacter sp. K5869 TaxID=2820808 RepID=UPI001C061827|nr:hypothetical protein [Lysobacter sp. K5869]QWP76599.1 hypothetical protein J5226_23990 [Lysobacter sp. K5869]